MQIPDVNVLLYAHSLDSPYHAASKTWLEDAATTDLGLPEIVWVSFVRIISNPRVFPVPMPIEAALIAVEELLASPGARLIHPGQRHLTILRGLCRAFALRGDAVPDAYLAALAIEHDAVLCSADRGFRRFPGLALRDPRDSP